MLDAATVLGGGSLAVPEYADFLVAEYLRSYLPAGGAAVKVVVAGSADTALRLERSMSDAATSANCLFVSADSAHVRVDQVEQVFFAVARALDWDALAEALVREAWSAAEMPAGRGVKVADVAAQYDLDPGELYRSVRRQLEQRLLVDP